MKIISKYIIKELIGPFFLSFSIITFGLLINVLQKRLDLLVSKGVGFDTILQLLAYSVAFTVTLTVPMSLLVATLMAYGRMSADFEIVAFSSLGINAISLIKPSLRAGAVATLLMIFFSAFVLPESNHKFAELLTNIALKNPTVDLYEGVFLNYYKGYNLFIRKLDKKTGKARDITIIEESSPTTPKTIVAEYGKIEFINNNKIFKLN